jgi:chloramphenicol 3-O phosphotransferase
MKPNTPIILLNGPSSAGKTTLARALQSAMPAPFFYFSSDHLVDSGVLPVVDRSSDQGPWAWQNVRPRFFDAFHRCVAAIAAAGNPVIVEHVIEFRAWFDDLVQLLASHDVFYVGVHCPLAELQRRELQRGDRYIGEAESHLRDGVHTWSAYDFELDTTLGSTQENARQIERAFAARVAPSAFRGALAACGGKALA